MRHTLKIVQVVLVSHSERAAKVENVAITAPSAVLLVAHSRENCSENQSFADVKPDVAVARWKKVSAVLLSHRKGTATLGKSSFLIALVCTTSRRRAPVQLTGELIPL